MYTLIGLALIVVAVFSFCSVMGGMERNNGKKFRWAHLAVYLAVMFASISTVVAGALIWHRNVMFTQPVDEKALHGAKGVIVWEKVTVIRVYESQQFGACADTVWALKLGAKTESTLYGYQTRPSLWLKIKGQDFQRIKVGTPASYQQDRLRYDIAMATTATRIRPYTRGTFITDSCSAVPINKP